MPMRRSLFSLPRLLAAVGMQGEDLTPEEYQREAERTGQVFSAPRDPNGGLASLRALGQKGAEELGIIPRDGETLGSYWGREYPSVTPPGLQQSQGQDIQLFSEGKNAGRRPSLAGLKKAVK